MTEGSKRDVEIPTSVLDRARNRNSSKGDSKDKPLTLREAMEMKQQEYANRIAASIMGGAGGDGKGKVSEEDSDKWMDKLMKLQAMKYTFSSEERRRSDDDVPSWVKELREENRLIRERLEKKEEEERIEKMRQEYKEEIKELRAELKESHNPNKRDELTDKITELESKLFKKEEDEKQAKLEAMFGEMRRSYDDLNDRIAAIGQGGNKSDLDSLIEDAEKFEKRRNTLKKVFGLTDKDAEQMGIGDVAGEISDMLPKIGEGVRTISDAFRPRDIEDDIPAPPPNYNTPQRNVPVNNEVQINPEIEAFLKRSTEKRVQGKTQMVDPQGVEWTTIDGTPLSIQEVRELAVVDPDTILDWIERAKASPPPKVEKPQAPKKKVEEPPEEEKEPEPEEAPEPPKQESKKKQQEPEKREREAVSESQQEAERETAEEPVNQSQESPEQSDAYQNAMEYISNLETGKIGEGDDAPEGLIGPKGEVYYTMDDEGNPVGVIDSPEVLLSEAEKNPEEFMNIVKKAQQQAEQEREQNGK